VGTKDKGLRDELAVWTDFERPTLDDWREAAQRGLRGADLESLTSELAGGLTVDPLYWGDDNSPAAGYPGLPPFTRGSKPLGNALDGWTACQLIAHPDPAEAGGLISEEIERGATAAWCRIDAAARCGMDGDDAGTAEFPVDGLVVSRAADFGPILDVVDPTRFAVHLDGGGNGIALAAAWVAACRDRNADLAKATGSFGWDPLGSLAADGTLPYGIDRSLELVPDLAAWAHHNTPRIRGLSVSTVPYHLAGASPIQELAFAAATGVDYLRRVIDAGMTLGDACRQLRFTVAVGRELFVEIAKLRVLRRVWSRVIEAFGGDGDCQRAPIHAVTSPRCLSRRDPWVNMLRTTVESFAAVAGGADTLSILTFDDALGRPEELGRRVASNVHAIMAEESHLHRLVDPAGGSYFVENTSDQMAHRAWHLFQKIEGLGGMTAAIRAGKITREVAGAASDQETLIANRRMPVTGVSSFANLAEEPVVRTSVGRNEIVARVAPLLEEHRQTHDPGAFLAALSEIAASPAGNGEVMESGVAAFTAGATVGQVAEAIVAGGAPTRVTPLPARREATDFERLRDASDARLESTGARPRAFLANMGPVPEHRLRADFTRNLLEAGGIETLGSGGFDTVEAATAAFAASGTTTAAICSSDERYVETASALARSLKDAGAGTVILAGRPASREAEWRDAGVDLFIFAHCDALAVLTRILRDQGVIHE